MVLLNNNQHLVSIRIVQIGQRLADRYISEVYIENNISIY